MNEEEYGLLPEGEVPEKPKPQLKDFLDEFRSVKPWQRIRPTVIALFHGFLAFAAGSIVNYLVITDRIRPQNVTQITVAILVFMYLRFNHKLGNKNE